MKFEVLCVDQLEKVDFTDEARFIQAISSNDKLCDEPLVKISDEDSYLDSSKNIKWIIQKLDVTKVFGDFFSSAFIVIADGDSITIESLRINLIRYIKKIGFNHVKVLTDEVSQEIASEIYPMINNIECLLRRYISKFFLTRLGLDWFQTVVPSNFKEKAKIRSKNENLFNSIINPDVELIDFNELGAIICQQKTAFSKPEEIIKEIEKSNSLDELKSLVQGSYAKYFKDYFEKNEFESKWNRCHEIRNKVAHNYLFVRKDLEDTKSLVEDLKTIINRADEKIDKAVLSLAEKEAYTKKAVEESSEEETFMNTADLIETEPSKSQKVSEEKLINILVKTEEQFRQDGKDFVGLGFFVKSVLVPESYPSHISYPIINILNEKGKIEIYEVENPYGSYPTKAIRSINS